MSTIVAGRFETQADADRAIDALGRASFETREYMSFYITPPGQHGHYPLGGDAHHDEGTRDAGTTAAVGGALGAAAGVAAGVAGAAVAAASGPALAAGAAIGGASVGAYAGSLAGGLKGSRGGDIENASTQEPVERASGIMVAVCVDRADTFDTAVDVLRAAGALEIERAQGEWRDGEWVDFDARRPPQLIGGEGARPKGP